MKLLELFEAPIDNFTKIGNWEKNSSFGTTDRAILNSPKGVQKIITKWKNTPVSFNVMMVNNPEGRRFQEWGLVSDGWLQENLPRTIADPNYSRRDDAVNVLFMSNTGDQRVQMSGWVLAHRFGHALGARESSRDFKDAHDHLYQMLSPMLECYGLKVPAYYSFNLQRPLELELLHFFHAIGTFKSARDRRIRNPNEFFLECFAQYMVEGSIRFNPLPVTYKAGRHYRKFDGTDMDREYFSGGLEDLAEGLREHFINALHYATGQVFVM